MGHPLEVRVRGHEFASCQRDGGGVSAQLGTPSPLDPPPPTEPAMGLHLCGEPSSNYQTAPMPGTLESRRGQREPMLPRSFEKKKNYYKIKTERERLFTVKFTVIPHWGAGGWEGAGLIRKFRVVAIQKLQCLCGI